MRQYIFQSHDPDGVDWWETRLALIKVQNGAQCIVRVFLRCTLSTWSPAKYRGARKEKNLLVGDPAFNRRLSILA